MRFMRCSLWFAALLLIARPYEAHAGGRMGGQQGGGQRSGNMSAPQRGGNAQRPANIQRPSAPSPSSHKQQGGSRLPTNAQNVQRPSVDRPQNFSRPSNGTGGSLQRPSTAPATRPALQNPGDNRPQNRPAPGGPALNKPLTLPSGAPAKRPAGAGQNLSTARPLPGQATRPAARPGTARPGTRENAFNKTDIARSKDITRYVDQRPGGLDGWENSRNQHWDNWHGKNEARLDNFDGNREQRWNEISNVQNNRQDYYNNRREDWQSWSNDRMEYRRDRSYEVWDNVRDYHCNLFVPNWYYGNSWWRGPVLAVNTNPWWLWRPAAWAGVGYFFGRTFNQPATYDYGTSVYVDQNNYYVNGKAVAPAAQYREQAFQMASVEPPPAPLVPSEDAAADWLPLGVWALTQEEKGDAVMFYQLAVNKKGIVSGAYSNVLTGESSPVTGSVDFETQRVSWRTGDGASTVIEANLHGLTGEFTTVFVHFASGQTQEWLLVRLPEPDDSTAASSTPPAVGAGKSPSS
ncbi:MAG: hypothetical protein WCI38_08560 [Chthoniobacterales bacterium]